MTAAELSELIERDPITAFCYLVAESGCQMTPAVVQATEMEPSPSARQTAEARLLSATMALP